MASFRSFFLAVGFLALAIPAAAQEVTLRVHHFLPVSSTTHADFIVPWTKEIEAQSGGRIAFQIFPAMQLGGRPPSLYDQVRDGVVDIVWTLPGYTPGRFPLTEVFELPFMPATAEATSQAVQVFGERHLLDEYADVKVIMWHAHGPGSFHLRDRPIRSLNDLSGARVRAPTRSMTSFIEEAGGTAIAMPAPAVTEALSQGVIDGAVLPYEVTLPLKVHELTNSHTEIAGPRGLYTAVFLFAMNRQRYESLPEDLRRIIDRNSGLSLAKRIGAVWDLAERVGRNAAVATGADFHRIPTNALPEWRAVGDRVVQSWIADRRSEGRDGAALYGEAVTLVRSYSR